jgi:hypothetical protein
MSFWNFLTREWKYKILINNIKFIFWTICSRCRKTRIGVFYCGTCTNNLGNRNCVWISFKLVSHITKCQYTSAVRQWNADGRDIASPVQLRTDTITNEITLMCPNCSFTTWLNFDLQYFQKISNLFFGPFAADVEKLTLVCVFFYYFLQKLRGWSNIYYL